MNEIKICGHLSHLRNLCAIEVIFFYTPPNAWRGKIYGMAWEENFPRHAKIRLTGRRISGYKYFFTNIRNPTSKIHLNEQRKMVGYATGIIGTAKSAEGMSVLVYEKSEGAHFGLRFRLWF